MPLDPPLLVNLETNEELKGQGTPDNMVHGKALQWSHAGGQNAQSVRSDFKGAGPSQFEIEMSFETHMPGEPAKDVRPLLKPLDGMRIEGENGYPPVCHFSWGTVNSAVLVEDSQVWYTRFDPSGIPTAARVRIRMTEARDQPKLQKSAGLVSGTSGFPGEMASAGARLAAAVAMTKSDLVRQQRAVESAIANAREVGQQIESEIKTAEKFGEQLKREEVELKKKLGLGESAKDDALEGSGDERPKSGGGSDDSSPEGDARKSTAKESPPSENKNKSQTETQREDVTNSQAATEQTRSGSNPEGDARTVNVAPQAMCPHDQSIGELQSSFENGGANAAVPEAKKVAEYIRTNRDKVTNAATALLLLSSVDTLVRQSLSGAKKNQSKSPTQALLFLEQKRLEIQLEQENTAFQKTSHDLTTQSGERSTNQDEAEKEAKSCNDLQQRLSKVKSALKQISAEPNFRGQAFEDEMAYLMALGELNPHSAETEKWGFHQNVRARESALRSAHQEQLRNLQSELAAIEKAVGETPANNTQEDSNTPGTESVEVGGST